MKYCKYCGAKIEDDAQACFNCGSRQESTTPTTSVNTENSTISRNHICIFLVIAAMLAYLFMPYLDYSFVEMTACEVVSEGLEHF